MPEVEINDLAAVGIIRDRPLYQMPPEAWLVAENVRVVDDAMETINGWERVLGSGTTGEENYARSTMFLMGFNSTVGNFILLVGTNGSCGVYNGTSFFNITRNVSGGVLTVTDPRELNGTLFGGIPIINTVGDIPQYWPAVNTGTRLANLTNWPSTLRTRVMRSFKNHLIALGLVESGTQLPHTMQWSHPAAAGAIPTSWDYTNPAVDARRKDFEDVESGIILDGLPLGGNFYIYKESAIHRMKYIGGRNVFGFDSFIETAGLLATRCLCAILAPEGPRHVFMTQDDVLWHNGSTARSALDGRTRRALFDAIDTQFYMNSFIFDHPRRREVWVCYPTPGNTHPNKAMVLNYSREPWRVTEVTDIPFTCAAVADLTSVATASNFGWETQFGQWDQFANTSTWTQSKRRQVLCGDGQPFVTSTRGLLLLDSGETKDGTTFTSTLQRTNLSILGKKRNGEWIVDHQRQKIAGRVWPKIESNTTINVRLGASHTVDGATTWRDAKVFDPATQVFVDADTPASGRALAIEFTCSGQMRVEGYKINVIPTGQH